MRPNQFRLCLALLIATSAAHAGDSRMTFFVTSEGIDGSARLGGLRGADAHCQRLAEAAGVGRREWHAYLSTAAQGASPGISARDRIGTGPWHNVNGELVARDVDDLHSGRNRLDRRIALTEKGEPVPAKAHDILTGSDESGRLAYAYGEPATCSNWTSNGDGTAMMGHHDRFLSRGARFPYWSRSWVASHPSRGCDAARISQTGSAGLFYCFATDGGGKGVSPPHPPLNSDAEPVSELAFEPHFKRGLNIAHWLSHNYLPEAPYGATWFDEEDVTWIAAQGFDHLRLRIAGDRLIDQNGDIDEANIVPIDKALRWARRHHLGIVLTMLSLPGFRHAVIGEPEPTDKSSPFTDIETLYDAEYVWWHLARRYADEGKHLRFEVLHRPGATDKLSMRNFNETMLKTIRASNPDRVVYLTSRDMQLATLAEVMESDVIASDWNVALAFEDHKSSPFEAYYPQYIEAVKRAAWGRELYLAEYGVCEGSDDAYATSYLRKMRDITTQQNWSWALYDYQSGCAVRDDKGNPTRVLSGLELSRATP
ncbi:hypothetical protein C7S18_08240 [Ahniella affigens]|uniref:Glycoside hydrolase family 5 domain-containing protein n=1 Tax=Ahniella affigens TaxID=2021234 RepID=A0A2P1PQQ6_9GAMM|nr:cellulase family glycosylhydrolase [Ahniella affigens]AVP97183.1 hypothetical protein C7S18_08240 [Ahniella affigens]